MIYFVLYAVLLVVVVLLYIKNGVKLSLFNIYFGLFLLFYGPAFFIYNDDNNLFEKDYTITTAQMLTTFVVCFFIGKFIFNKRHSKKLIERTNYVNWIDKLKHEKIAINSGFLRVLVLFTTVVIALGLFLYGGITSLLSLIRNPFADAQVVKDLRAEGGVSGWIAPLYTYTIAGLARLISFVFIGWAFQRRSLILKILGLAFAFLLGVAYLANLSKSSFIVYYTQLLFFLLLLFNVRINFKKVIVLLCLIVPVLVFIYIVATQSSSASQASSLIVNRIFNEPNRVLQLYPEFYPRIYPYANGLNIRVIHDLFSDDKFIPANIAVASGLEKVSFNAMFIADAYVDFSFFGIIFQSILVGYLLSYLDFLVFSRNNFLMKALFASLLFGIFALINSGLIASLFAFGLITLPIWSYLLEKNSKRRRAISRNVFPTIKSQAT
ncbi:MAG: hypothetical protein JWP37_4580 [Mucilaginibacter sp.]|nr:hypothetical protein [Mucilaginibacter sp.]